MKKRRFKLLAFILTMIFVLSGCGASESDMKTESSVVNDSAAWSQDMSVEEPEAEEVVETTDMGTNAGEVSDPNRKLIKRYNLNMETEEFDDLVTYIQDSVTIAGGYIENSNVSGTSIGGSGNRSAYYVLRIPVSDAVSFVEGLERKGNVTYKTEEVDDVTLSYVDTESRIEALRIEQETLMEMLGEATELDTILTIQNRLTEVRYQLESYESQLRSYDNLIAYTTVTIDLYEVKRETATDDGSFSTRLKNSFADGFYNFGQGAQNVIIALAGTLPYWILLAVIGLITVLIVKMVLKYLQKKEEKKMREIDLAMSAVSKAGAPAPRTPSAGASTTGAPASRVPSAATSTAGAPAPRTPSAATPATGTPIPRKTSAGTATSASSPAPAYDQNEKDK